MHAPITFTTLVATPDNPIPEGAVCGRLKTRDGVGLRFARFPARTSPCRGTVALFQGRAEFIEKYFEVIEDLRQRGFAVATLDWRGQGGSERLLADAHKCHIDDFARFELDIDVFVRDVLLPDCPPPHFALAHSMGGAILIRSAHEGRRTFERIAMSAPMIGLAGLVIPGVIRKAAKVLAVLGFEDAYIPGGSAAHINRAPFAANPLTSDNARYARTAEVIELADYLGVGSPTIGWAAAAFRVMEEFADPAYPSSIRLPILAITAGSDVVCSTPEITAFASYLRTGGHVMIPGARHEPMMERDALRTQFWAAFDAFIPGTPVF